MPYNFKPVKNYEGIYEISGDGKIYSIKRQRVLEERIHRQGYRTAMLCLNGEMKSYYIHRLIAESFLEKQVGKDCVNHKDGNKSNNSVYNLEWVNRSENTLHKYATGLDSNKGERHPQTKLKNEDVLNIRYLYHSGNLVMSKIAKMYKISENGVSKIINRKNWKHI